MLETVHNIVTRNSVDDNSDGDGIRKGARQRERRHFNQESDSAAREEGAESGSDTDGEGSESSWGTDDSDTSDDESNDTRPRSVSSGYDRPPMIPAPHTTWAFRGGRPELATSTAGRPAILGGRIRLAMPLRRN